MATRLAGLIRLGHPFPSLVNAVAVAVLATVAGAPMPIAARLALAMFLVQVSIGAGNDLADRARDVLGKPGKPLAAGLVGPAAARVLAVGALVIGLGLVVPSGPATLAVAAFGAGLGHVYNLVARGTWWSWLPLALAIPLVPVYAWLGAAASLPPWLGLVVPAGIAAGAGLAVSNAAADLERDRASGKLTVATRLGARRAWWAQAGAWSVALVIAAVGVASGDVTDRAGLWPALALIGGLIVVAGVLSGWSGGVARRQRTWELQAIGLGVLGAGWLGFVA